MCASSVSIGVVRPAFLLIITILCRDIVWLIAHKLTILPAPFRVLFGIGGREESVNMRLRDACRHGTNHGHVSFCVRNDRP